MFRTHCQMLSTKGNALERFPRSKLFVLSCCSSYCIVFRKVSGKLGKFHDSLKRLFVYENSHNSAKRYLLAYLVRRIISLNCFVFILLKKQSIFYVCAREVFIFFVCSCAAEAVSVPNYCSYYLVEVIMLRAKRIIHCNVTHLSPLSLKMFNDIKIHFQASLELIEKDCTKRKLISALTGMNKTDTYNFYFRSTFNLLFKKWSIKLILYVCKIRKEYNPSF